jgi:hypothetical protein
MAKKQIFIGSARESEPLGQIIAKRLSDCGYFNPLRWWDLFKAGSITLDRLLEIAEAADGAIFLFTADDKTVSRKQLNHTARDNVILEYGVFVKKLGRHRTLVLKHPKVRLPADIHAINCIEIKDDSSAVAYETEMHFRRVFKLPPPPIEAVNIVADPSLVEKQLSPTSPRGWHLRNLYVGLQSAKDWLGAASEPSYVPARHADMLRSLLHRSIADIDIRSFVSFGPGGAEIDNELATKLRAKEPWIQYIPVDICLGLLEHAMTTLSHEMVVPIGILADFEERLDFIEKQLRQHAKGPILYALLGNTFGNLEKNESVFITHLRGIMSKMDYLLLDVSLGGAKWNLESDRRAQHSSYGPQFRRFIANGIARRTHEPIEKIVEEFEERIYFKEGHSIIPNTNSIRVMDKQDNALIYSVRRYHWDSLISWLKTEHNLEIIFAKSYFFDDQILGDGVILAKPIFNHEDED